MTDLHEFMVETEIDVPSEVTVDELAALRSGEAVRASELVELGALVRIWRPNTEGQPGDRWANVGLWRARSRRELDAYLGSLPLSPYMSFTVTPLDTHPNDPVIILEDENESHPAIPSITGSTKVCFVIAHPVAHLRTPQGLNGLWAKNGGDFVSVAADVPPEQLSAFLDGMRANHSAAGAVVTVPHKQSVVPLCDSLGPNARLVGAVNAIRRDPAGLLIGETFDGLGFVAGLRAEGIEPAGMRVLVAGAGGAASAVAVALLQAGITQLDIVNRTKARGDELASRLRAAFADVEIGTGPARIGEVDLAINATSSGMVDSDASVIDARLLPSTAIAAEVVMTAQPTAFLRDAARSKLRTHEGHHMLAGQLQLIAEFMAG